MSLHHRAEVQKWGLFTLTYSKGHERAAAEAKAAKLIVVAMKAHDKHPQIQDWGSVALAVFCALDSSPGKGTRQPKPVGSRFCFLSHTQIFHFSVTVIIPLGTDLMISDASFYIAAKPLQPNVRNCPVHAVYSMISHTGGAWRRNLYR